MQSFSQRNVLEHMDGERANSRKPAANVLALSALSSLA
jgi:hypothetical protein